MRPPYDTPVAPRNAAHERIRHFILSAGCVGPSLFAMDVSDNPRSSPALARWAPVVLVALPFALYWNTLGVPFFFDDPMAIVDNPTIRNLGAWGEVLRPPNNGSGVTGRPVVNLSLALNYACGGTAVAGYHFANILFHVLGTLALFGIVRRTLQSPVLRDRCGSAATPLAFLTALLWSVHPLQTESVTCVIQRTEVLLGLFYLATLYGFVRSQTGGSRGWAAASIAACWLGMGTKEVMISAPLLVFLYDRTFIAGSFAEAWRRRKGYYLGLAAGLLLLAYLVISAGGTRGTAAGFGVGVTWWSYALKQCEAILLYLRLTVWPHPLVLFYGTDVIRDPLAVWPHVIILTGLVTTVLVALVRAPVAGFAGLWFFAILAPSSSVVPLVSQTVSEHRMYLPLAAPLAAALVGLYLLAGRRAFVVAGVIAALFGALTVRRNTDYRSEITIWRDTVAKAPANARARVNLGSVLQALGRPDEARREYEAALRLDADSPEAQNNLATILLDAGRPAEAIAPAEAALRLRPDFVFALNNLGSALVRTGRFAEGAVFLERAVTLRPAFPEAHCNLASAYTQLRQTAKALEHGRRAVQLRPDLALAHFFLAGAHLQAGDMGAAQAGYAEAARLNPLDPDARANLGAVLYQNGRPAEAIPHFEAVVRLRPELADAHNNLAGALFQTGRTEEAVTHYRTAVGLQPANLGARLNLGLVLARLGRQAEAAAAYEDVLQLAPDNAAAKAALQQLRGAK